IGLARVLDAPGYCIAAVAAAFPWLPYMTRVYSTYENDYLAAALAPWICLAMLRIEPLISSEFERWDRLLMAGLLAGMPMLVKFSLAPALAAGTLYMLWLDGLDSSRRRILRVSVFSAALVAPWILILVMNWAWG